jgi:HK97 family phage major capsid protein
MKTVAELQADQAELTASIEAFASVAETENRELTAEEQTEVDTLMASLDEINDEKLPRAIKLDNARKEAKRRYVQNENNPKDVFSESAPQLKVPAKAKLQRTRNFTGPDANANAYASGRFLMASILKDQKSLEWCKDNGVVDVRGAMSEGTNSAGGFLVPDPLSQTVINLQEEYGVFQRYSRNQPMGAETLNVPRQTAGLTVYYPGENTAITATDLTFAQATLTAKKYAALTLMSSEVSEDAVISLADLVAEDMGRKFATAIDTNAFLGDGTGTYASVTGFDSALHANSIVDAASGNTSFATLDLSDFNAVIAATPVYPGAMNRWYISSYGYWSSMGRLMEAAPGNNTVDFGNGPVLSFLGAPVTFTQVLPGSGASAGDNVAFYGDLSLASTFGMRREMQIATSNEVKFVEDQIAIRATERVAITVHEGTAASPVGPVVGLALAAS